MKLLPPPRLPPPTGHAARKKSGQAKTKYALTDITVHTGGLALTEGFELILPEIGPALGRLVGRTLRLDEMSCGRYGCVLYTDDDAEVVKITGDPSEALGWLFVQERQRAGDEPYLAGAVHVLGVWKVEVDFPGMFGTTHPKTFGVALLERVVPGHRTHHRPSDPGRLARGARGLLDERREPKGKGKIKMLEKALAKADRRALLKACRMAPDHLEDLCRMMDRASSTGVWFWDAGLHNLGWRLLPRPPALVLYDLGRVIVSKTTKRKLRRWWKALPTTSLRPGGRRR